MKRMDLRLNELFTQLSVWFSGNLLLVHPLQSWSHLRELISKTSNLKCTNDQSLNSGNYTCPPSGFSCEPPVTHFPSPGFLPGHNSPVFFPYLWQTFTPFPPFSHYYPFLKLYSVKSSSPVCLVLVTERETQRNTQINFRRPGKKTYDFL